MEVIAETWRPAFGWEGLYEVSDQGRVRSLDRVDMSRGHAHRLRGKTLRPVMRGGYWRIDLAFEGRRESWMVHRLMAATFLGWRDGLEVRHLDDDPDNNRLENLVWGTRSENELDKTRLGTNYNVRKTHCPAGHSYAEHGFQDGKSRRCKVCHTETWKRNYKIVRRSCEHCGKVCNRSNMAAHIRSQHPQALHAPEVRK